MAANASDKNRENDERDAQMRVAAAAAAASRLEDVLEQTAEAALEALGAASLSISRWEREEDAMRTLINVGELGPQEQRFPTDEVYPLAGDPLVDGLLRNIQPYHTVVDDPDAPKAAVDLLRALGKESELAVPIVVEGQVWGEVWAATAPGTRRFDQRDIHFLEAIAGQLALVISRAERYSKVTRLAYEDPLTGLANRRAIEERLELILADRTTHPLLTVMLCDVDRLKRINDEFGHETGDEALRRVGDALVAAAAAVDGPSMVGRLAGDEFCVLIEHDGAEAAKAVAHDALDRLSTGDGMPIAVSFGVAVAGSASRPAELLRAADDAQYAAKRRGGAMVQIAPSDSAPPVLAGRRLARDGDLDQELEDASTHLLDLLDSTLAGDPTATRVEAVAVGYATVLNCASWAAWSWEPGADALTPICAGAGRDGRLRGRRGDPRPLAATPKVESLLVARRGAFIGYFDGTEASAADRERLQEGGFTAALTAAAPCGRSTVVVELYGDEQTVEMAGVAVRLQLLLRVACAS